MSQIIQIQNTGGCGPSASAAGSGVVSELYQNATMQPLLQQLLTIYEQLKGQVKNVVAQQQMANSSGNASSLQYAHPGSQATANQAPQEFQLRSPPNNAGPS